MIFKVIKKKKIDVVGRNQFERDVIKCLQLGTFESFLKELILHIKAKSKQYNKEFQTSFYANRLQKSGTNIKVLTGCVSLLI